MVDSLKGVSPENQQLLCFVYITFKAFSDGSSLPVVFTNFPYQGSDSDGIQAYNIIKNTPDITQALDNYLPSSINSNLTLFNHEHSLGFQRKVSDLLDTHTCINQAAIVKFYRADYNEVIDYATNTNYDRFDYVISDIRTNLDRGEITISFKNELLTDDVITHTFGVDSYVTDSYSEKAYGKTFPIAFGDNAQVKAELIADKAYGIASLYNTHYNTRLNAVNSYYCKHNNNLYAEVLGVSNTSTPFYDSSPGAAAGTYYDITDYPVSFFASGYIMDQGTIVMTGDSHNIIDSEGKIKIKVYRSLQSVWSGSIGQFDKEKLKLIGSVEVAHSDYESELETSANFTLPFYFEKPIPMGDTGEAQFGDVYLIEFESTGSKSTWTDSISGITKAAKAVITVNGHPFVVDDEVTFSGISGMTEMNDKKGRVTATATNTITVDIDSTGFTTYTSGGTASADRSALVQIPRYSGTVRVAYATNYFNVSSNTKPDLNLYGLKFTEQLSGNSNTYPIAYFTVSAKSGSVADLNALDFILNVNGLCKTSDTTYYSDSPFKACKLLLGSQLDDTQYSDTHDVFDSSHAYYRKLGGALTGRVLLKQALQEICRNSASRLSPFHTTANTSNKLALWAWGTTLATSYEIDDTIMKSMSLQIGDALQVVNTPKAVYNRQLILQDRDDILNVINGGDRGYAGLLNLEQSSQSISIFGNRDLRDYKFDLIADSTSMLSVLEALTRQNDRPAKYIDFQLPYYPADSYALAHPLEVVELTTAKLPAYKGTASKPLPMTYDGQDLIRPDTTDLIRAKTYRALIISKTIRDLPELSIIVFKVKLLDNDLEIT